MKKILLATWLLCSAWSGFAQTDEDDVPGVFSEKPAQPEPFDGKVDLGPQKWWNNTVFYEIYTRSFQDSDGDGVGDLRGLISRLDYLNDGNPATKTDLGITGIWLMPIFEAKNDHGYDTTDYFKVAAKYGTNDDLKTLIRECHKRGIKLILDLVMNHTSLEHPWFLDAKKSDSPFHDFYVWSDRALVKKGPWGQSPVWHSLAADNYYYGVFNFSMPDLNLTNPKVTSELYKVVDYWLKEGIDGYRLDAIRYFVEDGTTMADTEATHDWLKKFYTHYKATKPDAFTVGEAMVNQTDLIASYTGDQVDTAFHFPLARAFWESVLRGTKTALEDLTSATLAAFPTNQWATFLSNHDSSRVMTELGGRFDLAKAAATLYLTYPGVPFIYYGEEYGQQGKRPSDENARRPVQWDSSLPGMGFTTGKPYGAGFNQPGKENTVAAEQKDPQSLWSLYRDLIALRTDNSSLRTGRLVQIETNRDQIYAFLRHDDQSTFLILANLGKKDHSDYGLALWSGPFKKGAQLVWRGGEPVAGGQLTAPVINSTGGFDAWTPVKTLKAKTVSVFQIK